MRENTKALGRAFRQAADGDEAVGQVPKVAPRRRGHGCSDASPHWVRCDRWQACQTRVTTKSYKFPELREPVLFETALDIESAAPLFF